MSDKNREKRRRRKNLRKLRIDHETRGMRRWALDNPARVLADMAGVMDDPPQYLRDMAAHLAQEVDHRIFPGARSGRFHIGGIHNLPRPQRLTMAQAMGIPQPRPRIVYWDDPANDLQAALHHLEQLRRYCRLDVEFERQWHERVSFLSLIPEDIRRHGKLK